MKSLPRHMMSGHEPPKCLGIYVFLWCLGCDRQHVFVFRCPGHGGPEGVVWEGDPYSDPPDFPPTPTSSNSLRTRWVSEEHGEVQCHSYVKAGQWQYLDDCTAHDLRGFYDLPDLPDWLADREQS